LKIFFLQSIAVIFSVGSSAIHFGFIWDQSILTCRSISEATVGLLAPGGPETLTMHLQEITTLI
jgi:hypothetical protein